MKGSASAPSSGHDERHPLRHGRFTRYLSWSEIVRLYRLTAPAELGRNDAPAYNVAPTDPVPFVTAGENGAHKLREGRWWLVPWWAKEMPKAAMFNARSVTADTSGAFKDAFASTRCLIPAEGFYEWTKSTADGKDAWHIFLPGRGRPGRDGILLRSDTLDACELQFEPLMNCASHGMKCSGTNPELGPIAIGRPGLKSSVEADEALELDY